MRGCATPGTAGRIRHMHRLYDLGQDSPSATEKLTFHLERKNWIIWETALGESTVVMVKPPTSLSNPRITVEIHWATLSRSLPQSYPVTHSLSHSEPALESEPEPRDVTVRHSFLALSCSFPALRVMSPVLCDSMLPLFPFLVFSLPRPKSPGNMYSCILLTHTPVYLCTRAHFAPVTKEMTIISRTWALIKIMNV